MSELPYVQDVGPDAARSSIGPVNSWISNQEEHIEDSEILILIRQTFPDDKIAIKVAEMMIVDGETSIKSIAARLGISEAVARGTKRRVRRRLAAALPSKGASRNGQEGARL